MNECERQKRILSQCKCSILRDERDRAEYLFGPRLRLELKKRSKSLN